MFGSSILEVAIGLVLVYLLLSALCTVITELVAQALAMRSRTLESGIRNLLSDQADSGLAKDLYDHPLIADLALKGRGLTLMGRSGKPSYIPSRDFALALLDIIAPPDKAQPNTIVEVRAKVTKIANAPLRRSLLNLIDAAGDDLSKARKNIETWFDDAMDRVSGWYKRKAQFIILAAALVISTALNADSIMLANRLWIDPTIRDIVVTAAQETIQEPNATGEGTSMTQAKQLQEQLQELQLPIGWSSAPDGSRHIPTDFWGWLTKVMGLVVTTIAVSFGAPFWFDALKNLVNLRAAGKPPERTSESIPA
jgi:hypothetical protein